MKTISLALSIFIPLLLLISNCTHAQREYWGVTTKGGSSFAYTNQGISNEGLGVIFKTDKNGQNQQVLHNFDSATGFYMQHSLTEAVNGKLYGVTAQISNGIPGSCGVLYEVDPLTGQYSIIKVLSANLNSGLYIGNGGRLLSAANGKLYGTRPDFVNNQDFKILYSYDPVSQVFTDLHSFTEGASVIQFITQGSNGKLYIMFEFAGGVGHRGAIMEYDISSNTAVMVHDFADLNGSQPEGGMYEWEPNIFYGCFANGDGSIPGLAKGGIYRFDAATRAYSMVARLDTIGGDGPFCALSRVGNKLYGATGYGSGVDALTGGIIFEFEPATNTLKKLYELCPSLTCQGYFDPLMPGYIYDNQTGRGVELLASNGLLYGLTRFSMFSFNTASNQFTNLFGLTSYKGRDPIGSLIEVCTRPYNRNLPNDTTILVTAGSNYSFMLHAPNSDSLQWQKDGVAINDTGSILNFSPFSVADTGRYTCRMVNECGTVITKNIYLKAGNATPVTLLNFTAAIENKNAKLEWQTTAEYNNAYFEIERKVEGEGFKAIGRVAGNGTSSITHNYSFTDMGFGQLAAAYYRLKQVDADGRYAYSRVVFLQSSFAITISPNPVKENLSIILPASVLAATAFIYDNKGSMLLQQPCKAGGNTIHLQNLPGGEYVIKVISTKGETIIKKIMVSKN